MIIAGHRAGDGTSALYTWDGAGEARAVTSIDLSAYNPEAFFTPEDRDEMLIASDDGEVPIDGEPCKKLDDPTRRRFRGVWIELPRSWLRMTNDQMMKRSTTFTNHARPVNGIGTVSATINPRPTTPSALNATG